MCGLRDAARRDYRARNEGSEFRNLGSVPVDRLRVIEEFITERRRHLSALGMAEGM